VHRSHEPSCQSAAYCNIPALGSLVRLRQYDDARNVAHMIGKLEPLERSKHRKNFVHFIEVSCRAALGWDDRALTACGTPILEC
jgi:hypothetical protein